ncbi:TonB-dependent receptor domain-containing protein [Pelagerythrobacter marinus]|uniref:TonB-dependent receptor domain-containing protein n=1 Tax=Pelagerythrobacter marinus TaxID=538382 RepID=UPI002036D253|nr:TonB-dependent receptor [Pelagerythrobacter marinus]USA38479.1 TonB-dependent receptor [Pelagerythrobacter marinus]WPZ07497.1 TonB-dependent receptor [Pelagerythrobacter marinus]
MSTGKQLAGLLLLTTALTFPGAALAQGTVSSPGTGAEGAPDAEGGSAPANEAEGPEEAEISIPGGGGEIIVTGRRTRDVTRSSTQVVSVLTSEQIARTGEGDIAGALGRVTGLSVQGQGFVYVRGLGDRYSLALLNGLPLPSPQPLSRVVPLDIFPTDVVASSLVQKTYSANFPGEFGGGVINLTTRAIPDESFLEISAGISGDEQTTFSTGNDYYGSDFDWFGFDDGTRDAPPALRQFFDSGLRMSDLEVDQQAIAKQLGNPNLVVTQKVEELPVNWSAGLTAGTSFPVFADGQFGVIATAGISNKWRNRSIIAQTAINADLDLDTDFRDFVTDNRILVNGLLGFGLELGDHRFRWTNLYIRDTLKQTRHSLGDDLQDGDTEFVQDTAWYERQLIDSQLVAELEFGNLDVDLRGGYAQTRREAPYEYSFTYVRTNNENDPLGDIFVNVLDRQRGSASVAFSNLKEELWYGGIDLGYALTDWLRLTAGYAYTDTDRYSERREFLFDADSGFEDAVGALRPDLLLGDAIIEYYDIGLIETTQSDPAFAAGLEIHAGYLQSRLNPVEGLTIDLGVRYEDATQRVDPVEVFATPTNSGSSTLLANDYYLPAGTITWELTDALQARISGSKTIARPQFRELIFQTYYDPETSRRFNGNPFLVDSELENYEARLEYYFGRGNRVSLAGFYKQIDNPIEIYSSFSDNVQVASFANAPRATLKGAELEFQYNHDLLDWGGWFETKRLVAVANYTFTDSEIEVGDDDTTQIFPGGERPATDYFRDGVPLTGQSDHLLNLQFGLEDLDRLQQFTVLFSYASERVTARGTGNLPDIVEDPGLRVDFVYRQDLNLFRLPVELKLEARNIFGRDHYEYQSNGTNRIEINTYEVGQSYALSLSTEF